MKLDPKIITWAIITNTSPLTYKFRKSLRSKTTFKPLFGKSYFAHFPNREKAEQFAESLKGLGTKYAYFFITDEDFGRIKFYDGGVE